MLDLEVLYDLEDERGNELLASIDLEDSVSDSATYPLTESEVSNEVNYENNERGGNLNRQRFEKHVECRNRRYNYKSRNKENQTMYQMGYPSFFVAKI